MSSANGRVLVTQDPDVAYHPLNHIRLIAPIIGADTELGVNQHETVAMDDLFEPLGLPVACMRPLPII